MDTIDLKCPSCQTRLTIDSGFAGGVCRCWKCGTLMTVPSRKHHRQNDASDRPQRPDAPLPRPAAPARKRPSNRSANAARPTPLPDVRMGSPNPSPNRPAGTGLSGISSAGPMHASHASARMPDPPAVAEPSPASMAGLGHEPSPASPAACTPSAPARRSRLGVLLVALAVLMLVAGSLLYVASTTQQPGRRIDQVILHVVQRHRARHNPLLAEQASFLGLPLDRKVVLVMDTAGDQIDWLAIMGDAAARAMGYLPPGAGMQVVGWSGQQPVAYPQTLRSVEPADRLGMAAHFAQLSPAAQGDPQQLMRHALMSPLTQVVLVTDRALTAQQVQALAQDLAIPPAIRFDAVLIGVSVPALEPVTRQYKGQYLKLTRQQLVAWQTQALDLQQADAAR